MSIQIAKSAVVPEGFAPYRAVSRAAIASLFLALISLLGLLFPAVLVLAVLAIGAGIVGLRAIRRHSSELVGRAPAWCGLMLAIPVLIGGVTYHSYVYATEVREGYERTSWYQLKPDPDHPEEFVRSLMALDGQKVFIKGYVHPGVSSQAQIRQFVLVPDMGTCCFGGQPKPTDMIEVTMTGPLHIRYNMRLRKLHGVFHLSEARDGMLGAIYKLEADTVE